MFKGANTANRVEDGNSRNPNINAIDVLILAPWGNMCRELIMPHVHLLLYLRKSLAVKGEIILTPL